MNFLPRHVSPGDDEEGQRGRRAIVYDHIAAESRGKEWTDNKRVTKRKYHDYAVR